jgi:uncharacterized BrkB/YihY/UPF0761 family membrane protein
MNKSNKATWWEVILGIVGITSIGIVIGAVIFGSILSIFFGPTYFSGILGAVLGIIVWYGYLLRKAFIRSKKK